MSSSLVAVSYLAAIILFILSLGGLSNPESSRRGNMYGMLGMAIAVLATLLARVAPIGLPSVAGAFQPNPGGPGRQPGRLRELLRPARPGRHVRRRGDHPPRRDLHRRADRRGDALRIGDRVRQALGPNRRQASAASGTPLAEPR